MILLPANLAPLANHTADHHRYSGMTCVRVQQTDTGYIADATDGKTAARVTGPAAGDPAEFPIQPGPEDNGAKAGFVPAAEWKAAFKAVYTKKRGFVKPVLRTVAAAFGIATEGETVTAKTMLAATDGTAQHVTRSAVDNPRFPPIEETIPDSKPAATIRVDPKLLADLLRTAAAFSADPDEPSVTIELHGNKPIVIRTKNADGQEFTGLLVPLT